MFEAIQLNSLTSYWSISFPPNPHDWVDDGNFSQTVDFRWTNEPVHVELQVPGQSRGFLKGHPNHPNDHQPWQSLLSIREQQFEHPHSCHTRHKLDKSSAAKVDGHIFEAFEWLSSKPLRRCIYTRANTFPSSRSWSLLLELPCKSKKR